MLRAQSTTEDYIRAKVFYLNIPDVNKTEAVMNDSNRLKMKDANLDLMELTQH